MIWCYILFLFLLVLILIKIYRVLTQGWCKSKVCLNGKTVIVTGSNTGIGYETALEFAKRGARVILACRDLQKADEARSKIICLTENKNIVVKELDTASLKSIKNFYKDITENEERLDILVNNAGTGAYKNEYTDDGLQLTAQVNYFGPVLLTLGLLDLLKKTGSSRIINVSSILADWSNLTVQNLNLWQDGMFTFYGNTKLALILFTIKLSRLLKASTVTVYSLHPGAVDTNIFRHIKGLKNIILKLNNKIFFKTPEEGAQTTLYAALEQGIEKYSGEYFKECQKSTMIKRATNQVLVDEIWEETVRLLNCEREVEHLRCTLKLIKSRI